MRPLSPSLLAAQRSSSRVPVVEVKLSDKLAGVARLRWERLYSGTEPDFYHTAVIAGDGAFIRVRIGLSEDNNRLYIQRTSNPGPLSDFNVWQNTGIYNCQAVAITSHGAEVNLFWANIDQSIRRMQSTDYGASWGAVQVIDYSPDPVTGSMSADCKENGDLAVF
ncbi:MAG TPA: hypothetical protein VEH58_07315, partial [Dehalococcoidales bacterium]|nr:hypothetical protein [Dehalococcoidales bacterium]